MRAKQALDLHTLAGFGVPTAGGGPAVTANGGGGTNTVLLDDGQDGATSPVGRTWAITGSQVTLDGVVFSYTASETAALLVRSGAANDAVQITGLPAAPATTTVDDGGSPAGGGDALSFAGFAGGVQLDLDTEAVQSLGGAITAGPYLQLLGTFENFTGSAGNDTVYVDLISGSGTRTIAGGGGTADTLSVDPRGQAVSDAGGAVTAPGYQTISYSDFENKDLQGGVTRFLDNGQTGFCAGQLVQPGRQLLRPALQRHRRDDARHQRRHGAVDVFQSAAGPVRGLGQLAGSGLADDPGDVQPVRRRARNAGDDHHGEPAAGSGPLHGPGPRVADAGDRAGDGHHADRRTGRGRGRLRGGGRDAGRSAPAGLDRGQRRLGIRAERRHGERAAGGVAGPRLAERRGLHPQRRGGHGDVDVCQPAGRAVPGVQRVHRGEPERAGRPVPGEQPAGGQGPEHGVRGFLGRQSGLAAADGGAADGDRARTH